MFSIRAVRANTEEFRELALPVVGGVFTVYCTSTAATARGGPVWPAAGLWRVPERRVFRS